jgi:serine/threonine-protein kinase
VRQETARLAGLGHPNMWPSRRWWRGGRDPALHRRAPDGIDLATIIRDERRLEGGRALDIAIQVSRALGRRARRRGRCTTTSSPSGCWWRRAPARPGQGARLRPGGAGRLDAGRGLGALPRPEQLTGTSADARADVYAAAALLYEMVTGAPPHAASADPIARKLAEPVQSPRMFRPRSPPSSRR